MTMYKRSSQRFFAFILGKEIEAQHCWKETLNFNSARSGVIAILCVVACCTPRCIRAEELFVTENGPNSNLCQTLEKAMPGDIVTTTGSHTLSSACSWSASGVHIRGSDANTTVRVTSEDRTWRVEANNTTIENILFEATGIESSGTNLTLRSVHVTGAERGLRVADAGSSAITIERSLFDGNELDIEVGEVNSFVLADSAISSPRGIVSRARQNSISGNRFSVAAEKISVSAFRAINGVRSAIENNVFYSETAADSTYIQIINEGETRAELLIARNTFVSRSGDGATFVETLGIIEPDLEMRNNIFWGAGVVEAAGDADVSADNYVGNDGIFSADRDFRLANGRVGSDVGASARFSSGFPLTGLDVPNVSMPSKDSGKRQAIAGLSVSQVVLQTSSASGASYLFSNSVRLNIAAPAGGVPVTITSSNPAVVQALLPTVTVLAGQLSVGFSLRTIATTTSTPVTITASANGTTATAVITVGPVSLTSMTLQATTIGGGGSTLLNRIYLSGPAPTGGMVINLTSSNSLVTVPATVTVGAAVNNAAFTIATATVSSPITATITAKHATGTVLQSLTVAPSALASALAMPASLAGGKTGLIKLVLTGPAPAGGTLVTLSTSDPTVASIATSAIVPAGYTEVSVPCQTYNVTVTRSISVYATGAGITKTAGLTVAPVALTYFQASTTAVSSGRILTLTVMLNAPAPVGGFSINITVTQTALAVPASIVVPANATTASFTAAAWFVAAPRLATVTATAQGVARAVAITVNPR